MTILGTVQYKSCSACHLQKLCKKCCEGSCKGRCTGRTTPGLTATRNTSGATKYITIITLIIIIITLIIIIIIFIIIIIPVNFGLYCNLVTVTILVTAFFYTFDNTQNISLCFLTSLSLKLNIFQDYEKNFQDLFDFEGPL